MFGRFLFSMLSGVAKFVSRAFDITGQTPVPNNCELPYKSKAGEKTD